MKTEYEQILTAGLNEANKKWLIQSLKDLSYDETCGGDDGPCYDCSHPTMSECKAISYDNLAMLHQVQSGAKKRLRSCDALYIGEENQNDGKPELYIIEFKNGEITEAVVADINEKIKDGVQLLNRISVISNGSVDLTERNHPKLKDNCNKEQKLDLVNRLKAIGVEGDICEYCINHMNFILVYNETKKTQLLNSDIDSFIDDIEDGMIYQDLEEAIENCLQNSISKQWLYEMADLRKEARVDSKNLLIRILKRRKASKSSLRWFDDLSNTIKQQGYIIKSDSYDTKMGKLWDSFTKEQRNEIFLDMKQLYEKWKLLQKSPLKRKKEKMALLIKQFITKMDTYDVTAISGNDVLLNALCSDTEQPSTLLFEKVVGIMKQKIQMKELEAGKYDNEIEKLLDTPVLIPLDYRNDIKNERERAKEFIKDKISNNELDSFFRELQGDSSSCINFTIHFAKTAQKPHSFFRFHQWEKLYVKTTATYGRIEFQEKFIENICGKKCLDTGA